jgi:hypothetical protein
MRHAGIAPALAAAAVPALWLVSAGAGRPPPPAEWTSRLDRPHPRPGAVSEYALHASSRDAFELRVTLLELPPRLRLARKGTSAYRVVAGHPTWVLRFPGRALVQRTLRLSLAVDAAARPGSKLCVRLRQVASNGGVPDVVPLVACDVVRAR